MEMTAEMIQTFGFPITCVIACAIFIFRMYLDNNKRNQEREDKLYETVTDVNAINKELSETNKELSQTNKTLSSTNCELVHQFKTEVLIMKNDIEDIKHAVLQPNNKS